MLQGAQSVAARVVFCGGAITGNEPGGLGAKSVEVANSLARKGCQMAASREPGRIIAFILDIQAIDSYFVRRKNKVSRSPTGSSSFFL